MSNLNLSEDPRAGLEITRYHSWARHRDQSVGEHSAQIARILLTIWPDCPRKMLVHCVTHDMGEMAGDVQYPFKKRVRGMREAHVEAEALVMREMREVVGMPPEVFLSVYEYDVFKFCEYVEMWEWGLREQNMGNRYGEIVATRCVLEAGALYEGPLASPPGGCPDLRPPARRYMDARLRFEGMLNTDVGDRNVA